MYILILAQQDGKRLNKCILKRKGMGDLIGLRYEYPAETVAASGKTECTNRSLRGAIKKLTFPADMSIKGGGGGGVKTLSTKKM